MLNMLSSIWNNLRQLSFTLDECKVDPSTDTNITCKICKKQFPQEHLQHHEQTHEVRERNYPEFRKAQALKQLEKLRTSQDRGGRIKPPKSKDGSANEDAGIPTPLETPLRGASKESSSASSNRATGKQIPTPLSQTSRMIPTKPANQSSQAKRKNGEVKNHQTIDGERDGYGVTQRPLSKNKRKQTKPFMRSMSEPPKSLNPASDEVSRSGKLRSSDQAAQSPAVQQYDHDSGTDSYHEDEPSAGPMCTTSVGASASSDRNLHTPKISRSCSLNLKASKGPAIVTMVKPKTQNDTITANLHMRVSNIPPTKPSSAAHPAPLSAPIQGLRGDLNTEALKEEARKIETLCLPGTIDPRGAAKKFLEDEVKTRNHEKTEVLKAINPFKNRLTKRMNEAIPWNWDIYSSGSHYDGTKVARVDEMDFMLVPELFRGCFQLIDEKELPPGYVFLKFNPTSSTNEKELKFKEFKDKFCSDELHKGLVSAKLYRETIFKSLAEAVDNERRAATDSATIEAMMKEGSPSFVVKYWCIPTNNGMKAVSLDLVLALPLCKLPPSVNENLKRLPELKDFLQEIKNDGCDVVPKLCKALLKPLEHYSDFVWRLSFSRAEKKLTRNFDSRLERLEKLQYSTASAMTPPPSPPTTQVSRPVSPTFGRNPRPVTCRKLILRYLKRLLELIKGMDNSRDQIKENSVAALLRKAVNELKIKRKVQIENFTTYQIRNLLWTKFYDLNRGNEKWSKDRLQHRLRDMLIQLRKMVSLEIRVNHFFIPNMDIMANVLKEEREFLYIMFIIAEDLLCGQDT